MAYGAKLTEISSQVLDFKKNRFLDAESVVYSFKKTLIHSFVLKYVSPVCQPGFMNQSSLHAIFQHGHKNVKLMAITS